MPYKDKDKQRQFQRESVAKRRVEFFNTKHCVICGSKENLGLLNTKAGSLKCSFSYAFSKLEEIATRCKILCRGHLKEELSKQISKKTYCARPCSE
jgi:hypothetical protein